MSDPRDLPLDWFKNLQFEKLSTAKNVAKTHWLDMTPISLLSRLKEEVYELTMAMAKREGSLAIIDECVDVANFAAMLAHNIRESEAGDD